MRHNILKLHFFLALVAGLVITTLGITGAIMAFEPEIDHLQHRALMDVTPAGTAHSLADVIGAVAQAFPGSPASAVTLGSSNARAYAVSTRSGQIYVDPYTLAIKGVRPNGVDWLANVHQMHLRLLTSWGKTVVAWSGVIMLFLVLSGLYLWWPVKRASVTTGKTPYRTWYDWHSVVGIFSFVFLLLLSATGVFIGFENVAVPLAYRVTGSDPGPAAVTRIAARPGVAQITPDAALEIARTAIPGAAPFMVPVVSPKDAYVVRSRFPEDLTPGGRSRVVIDSYTGAVMSIENSRTAPAGRRVTTMNRAIHTGDVFGLPSKIVMSIASLMAPVQLLTGVMLWWRRKPRGRKNSAPISSS
jgi:uncharacterized iron-regulated membrane protein